MGLLPRFTHLHKTAHPNIAASNQATKEHPADTKSPITSGPSNIKWSLSFRGGCGVVMHPGPRSGGTFSWREKRIVRRLSASPFSLSPWRNCACTDGRLQPANLHRGYFLVNAHPPCLGGQVTRRSR